MSKENPITSNQFVIDFCKAKPFVVCQYYIFRVILMFYLPTEHYHGVHEASFLLMFILAFVEIFSYTFKESYTTETAIVGYMLVFLETLVSCFADAIAASSLVVFTLLYEISHIFCPSKRQE